MKGTTGTGAAIEIQARDVLQTDGWLVHRVTRASHHVGGGRYVNNANDVFACDLICKKAGHETRWIQVTGGRAIGRKKANLELVPWHENDDVEIWRFVGGGRRIDGRTGDRRGPDYFLVYQRRRAWQATLCVPT